jgi:hypothetical protein
MTMLGNFLELSHLINPKYYSQAEPPPAHELAGQDFIISQYQTFQTIFCAKQQLSCQGRIHNPTKYLFKPSLLHMAITLIKYKASVHGFSTIYDEEDLVDRIKVHFDENHPGLAAKLQHDLNPSLELPYTTSFEWQGPPFSIIQNLDVSHS